jgi:N-acetylglucosaminyl-diphospho-decaprenol L-rhamnosyltransferase
VDLSIISVNFNSLSYLRECVASIYQWLHGVSFEVIIVDNASPAGDIDRLKEEFPEIKLIKSGKNLGFAGANNLGFKYSSGEWVVFLNPDTKLISPALNVMLERARSLPKLGIAGCRLLNSDGSVQTSSIMKFPGILNSMVQLECLRLRWPKLWGIGPLFSTSPDPVSVDAISGACMLVKREIFEKVAMFSEDYFMYSEDLDLCYKTARAGLRNVYIGQAEIIHYGGTSGIPEWQAVMKTQAELKFCEKNYGPFYTLLFRNVLAVNALARLTVMAILCRFAKSLATKQRLDSARARWHAILKTLLARDPSAACRLSKGAGYGTTSA